VDADLYPVPACCVSDAELWPGRARQGAFEIKEQGSGLNDGVPKLSVDFTAYCPLAERQ